MTSNPTYNIDALHFEVSKGGFTTIWFDLVGERFPKPEAMTNMYVGFDDFLQYISVSEPGLHGTLVPNPAKPPRQDSIVGVLDKLAFDWDAHLHVFLDHHFDLEKATGVRQDWLRERLARADQKEQKPAAAAQKLPTETEPAEKSAPTWDDVKHAFLVHLNKATVQAYPAFKKADAKTSGQLREIFDAYSERLANEIYLLAQKNAG